jgi:HAE1 family hydrophobic/amphiphilic exporter-1
MQLIDAFVHNPVKVAVGVLLVALFGIVALDRMPMQLTPEVQTPTITVETLWPGASPQEVEQEIVIEQEEQLKGVEGVVKLSSESKDSVGTITMEFLVGTNMDEALLRVNSRLQQVREYPEDADQPVITTANSSNSPIAWFILGHRLPTEEELSAFSERHPQLASELERVRRAPNFGVAAARLRDLVSEHPEFKELLPPEDLEIIKLRRFAEDEIESRFERVAGVSQSNVIGGLEDEIQVVVDPERLAARRITLTQVRNTLRWQNEDTSAGDFWEGKRRYILRVLSQFRSPEQVENQLLAMRDGAPVFVRDVAEVRHGYKKPNGLVRRFGASSIAINCIRESGANVLDVMEGLRQTTADLNENLLRRQGLELIQVYDETEYIYSAIDLVTDNIFVGGALTIIVLMLFLHLGVRTLLAIPLIIVLAVAAAYVSPWFFAICLAVMIGVGFWFARGALVVGLAIPTSIVGTFLVLGMLGRSLNVISLAGLAFAVGMLVDNAVVVLENIYRRHSLGERPFTAAVRGTQEVWGAVVASTLTTVAVFLPVVFVQEQAGQLFRDIALAISAAVSLSLVVSMIVIPPAAARLFRDEGEEDDATRVMPALAPRTLPFDGHGQHADSTNGEGRRSSRDRDHRLQLAELLVAPISQLAGAFVTMVVAMNHWIQRSTLRRLTVVTVLVGASAGVSWLLWPKVEYLPTGNRNLVFGIMLPPPGYNLDQLEEIGEGVSEALRPYWDVDPNSPEAQRLKYPVIGDFFFVAFGRQLFMGLRAHDPMRAAELTGLIQEVGSQVPGMFAIAKQSSLFEQGLSAGRTIDVEITGPELPRLVGMGGQVMGQVMGGLIPGAQAFPQPSLDLSNPEMHIVPKLVQAADMQVTSADLGFAVNALVDGAYAGDYYFQGKKIDLTITGELRFATSTQDIEALPIATPIGQLVPLGAVADVKLASGPEQINHRERVRAITIQVSPPPEVALEDAMQSIQNGIVTPLLQSGQLDGGFQINLAGTADKLRDTWQALRFNVILALLITYLLMAALFESWLYPLVIIFSVPLGAVGGVLGLAVLNMFVLQTLDVLTMLGFVILIGTVVNNPILIVHQSLNHMREDGMTPREAIIESVRTRIRPIFMTTITTVIGLLPLVLFPGAGSELYRGLGAVVLGGLAVSTLFTLVLVPTLFSLMLDARESVERLFGKRAEARVELKASEHPPARPTIPPPERVFTN